MPGGFVDVDDLNRWRDCDQRVVKLEAALRMIEAHHVKQNAAKGRDESESFTLRTCREALST